MINIGIVGFGNLGKSIAKCIDNFTDLHLFAVFSRRDPSQIDSKYRIESLSHIGQFKDQIDVLILALGSQRDIPELASTLINQFNTVDVYDNHAFIPEHFKEMNQIALENNKVSIISTGWDPGLFSLERTLADAVLPIGHTYTFWGPGLSQGHSDVVRHVIGVKYGVQYTIPKEEIVEEARQGKDIDFSPSKAHRREVYVVLEDNADAEVISAEIKSIPDYFEPYETNVHFISEEDFLREHQGMPHGGIVIRSGETSKQMQDNFEFKLTLESNPEFTASISLAYARAAARLAKEKNYGAKTVLDIPISYLSNRDKDELLAHFI
ncbi:MAG: diaminopimelate dehydrogenase [Clostridiaceae bacterium]|nr:diaminopimelate dehydrogenase [Clostridiaceae bacterium]